MSHPSIIETLRYYSPYFLHLRTLTIHPVNPQLRLVRQAADALRSGAVLAIPTDSTYAFACALDAKDAADRIRRLRGLGKDHLFTLICPDLSSVAQFARVDNWHFRILRAGTPGPYTFILKASNLVPRRVQGDRRKTVGVRVCAHPISQALVTELGEPLLACTAFLPGHDLPCTQAEDFDELNPGQIDLLVDGGETAVAPTTVVDMHGSAPELIREGLGDPIPLGL